MRRTFAVCLLVTTVGLRCGVCNDRPNEATQRVAVLIKQAQSICEQGDCATAIELLEEARLAAPGYSVIYFDEAVAYDKLRQRTKAIEQLDMSILLAPEGRQKEDAELLRAVLVTPEQVLTDQGGLQRDKLEKINRAFRKFYSSPISDVDPPSRLPCSLLDDPELKNIPSVVFNKAFCQEVRGDIAAATATYIHYLELVPFAQDKTKVEEHLRLLERLLVLNGEVGLEVQKRYGAVTFYTSGNRFDLALRALKEAEYLAPDWLETKKQIADLAIRLADFELAQTYYGSLLTAPAYAAVAEQKLDEIAWNRSIYQDNVRAAASMFGRLTSSPAPIVKLENSGLRTNTTALSTETTLRALGRASAFLNSALAVSDLGSEAHSLLSLAFQLTGNQLLAARSADIVRSHGDAVFFFTAEGERVDIEEDLIRVLDISKVEQSDRVKRIPPDGIDVKASIPASSISAIKVREGVIDLFLADSVFSLTPAAYGASVPENGPLARKHANAYARLISRYIRSESVKLGPERLSNKEVFVITAEVGMIAGTIALMTQGQVNGVAQGTWGRVSRINDILKYGKAFYATAPAILYFIEVLRQKQDVGFLPMFKLLPSRAPLLRFRTLW